MSLTSFISQSPPPRVTHALAFLGAAVAAGVVFRTTGAVWRDFLRPSRLTQFNRPKSSDGAWAMVTGASDGIGKGFATELCSQGFNVVLHGRNRVKLERLAKELLTDFPATQTRIAVQDASSFTSDDISALCNDLYSLPITLLINNVGGGGYGAPASIEPALRAHEDFDDSEIDFLESLNMRFATHLTARLLPHMKRTGGPVAVVNISSGTAVFPSPYLAIYSGAKAFNAMWSRSMAIEQRMVGRPEVEFLALVVGMVKNQTELLEESFFRVEARDFARSALRWLGHGDTIVTPHWKHALQISAFNSLPRWASENFMISVTKAMVEKERKSS